jgi:hypothetical protein
MIEKKLNDVLIVDLFTDEHDLKAAQMRELAKTHAAITICITDFTSLLKAAVCGAVNSAGAEDEEFSPSFEPITHMETLKRGFYGRLNGMEIYLNKSISPGSYVIGKVLHDNQ